MGKRVRSDGFVEYQGPWWRLALPQVILAVHLPLVAAAAAWAAHRSRFGARAAAAGLLVGWLGWTLFEYVFHRYLLHASRNALLKRVFWQGLHREHHGYRAMRDPDHHGIHVAISLPIVLGALGATAALFPGGFALAAAAGWALGYCGYEALHWIFHSSEAARGPAPLRRLWEAHRVHHLVRADRNYGFVTQVWDRCFGTSAPGRGVRR